jgi:RNA polymerase sigma-70 factor (ECF subfamily)
MDRPGNDLERSAATIETALLAQLRAQDQASWQRLHFLFGPVVQGWLKRAGVGDSDADDLRQEVLQAVFKSIDTFSREQQGGTFRGWLRRITQNKLRDHWRRERRQADAAGGTSAWQRLNEVADPENALLESDAAEPQELQELVHRAMELVRQDVQPHTWQAFWLVEVEGKSAEEAASLLGLKVGSIYTARSRMLVRLREALGPEFESVLGWK